MPENLLGVSINTLKMKQIEYLEEELQKIPKGYVFSLTDLKGLALNQDSVLKNLNLLAAQGVLSKLAKDRFYKPQQTNSGVSLPDHYQVVKDLLEVDGQLTGYLTGTSIYSGLGLTLQPSTRIQIGVKIRKQPIKRGVFKISYVVQQNEITPYSIPFLQVLDVIKNIKKVPQSSTDLICFNLTQLLTELNKWEHKTLLKYVLNYSPKTRALTGALLHKIGYLKQEDFEILKASLKKNTRYTFDIAKKILPNGSEWNIY
ncbi:hypothetical protein SAMN02745246_00742 [Leeuwenhoekiella marinoflava DSM 3653]|uniref:AbiEi antitoxin C-terminal domain-containing protein n=3 Tax=Leeuwenhoekiella marinoflava TaxID=988 RepID=A0A4Q0PSH8_9FLAO|nr:hypothetical protein DSL99_685 [Leeuwenhoekiella marinoflava]SHE61100.1 hypothetical protein SAMN02745246_00742 [Leeuwenhoekiella marinoflava DSM 3653]